MQKALNLLKEMQSIHHQQVTQQRIQKREQFQNQMQEFGNSESELLKKLGDDLSESKDLDLVQRKVFTICEQIT